MPIGASGQLLAPVQFAHPMEDRAFRPRDLYLRLLIAFCLAVISWIGISCFPEPGSGEKEGPIARAALGVPEGYENKSAARKNDDGIDHFVREHWRKAAADFHRALEVDPNLAVAQFNLALSLDRLGKHAEATEHFRRARELAPDDTRISGNEILKSHLE